MTVIVCPEDGTKCDDADKVEQSKSANNSQDILALWSMILGITGLVLSCVCIGVFLCVIGIVFSIIALKNKTRKTGMAVTGLITSVLGIVMLIFLLFVSVDDTTVDTYQERQEEQTVIQEVSDESKESIEEVETANESLESESQETTEEQICETTETKQENIENETIFDEESLLDMPIYSSDYLVAYLDYHELDLPVSKDMEKLNKILQDDSKAVYLKASGNPKKYVVTNEETNLLYVGKTKDNKPDGLGKIYVLVEACEEEYYGKTYVEISEYKPYVWDYGSYTEDEDTAMLMVYVGEFKEGYYSGYGWEYILPNDIEVNINEYYSLRDLGYDYVKLTDDLAYNVMATCNPIGYMGEFKKGQYHGEGIKIDYAMRYMTDSVMDEEVMMDLYGYRVDREIIFYVSDYKNGSRNGDTKEYLQGKLYFSGEMKNGEKNGEGTLYFQGTDQVHYKGGWKNGEYHGKGTLYDEDGSVIYKGKWKDGDYAS